jgi:uncharacterized protein YbcC (UPF0753/DUF2309 family)
MKNNTPNFPTMTSSNPTMFAAPMKEALERIPPLWPLSRFVAVNPFMGLSKMNFQEAASVLHQSIGASLAMPPSFYRERYRSGLITLEDLEKSILESIPEASSKNDSLGALIADLIASLQSPSWDVPKVSTFPLPSTLLDAAHASHWVSFASDEISKWCTAYFDQGQALWSFPWKGMPLFTAWKEASSLDYNPEISGITGWRNFVRDLPDDPIQVIEEAALKLNIPAEHAANTFHALLLGIGGWAGYLQFLAHEKQLRGEKKDSLVDLLAIRMVYEFALQSAFSENMALTPFSPSSLQSMATLPTAHLIWQRAHECAMQRNLFAKLASISTSFSNDLPPAFQAIFCIDVRSEIFRRSLEKVAPQCQTIGFAGFFGFPIELVPAGETNGTPQCPVLLKPAARVCEHPSHESLRTLGFRKRVTSTWKSFKSSAVSSFVFVEMAGLGFLPKIIRDLLHRPKTSSSSYCGSSLDITSIPVENQIAMAAGALRHLGLSKGGISRIVLICGHGSSTKNNPYRSSLDCGACGGHTGEANARTAAAILNNPAVRLGLAEKGVLIPEQTWFLGALHNTTTDEVILFDKESAPVSHQKEIENLEENLLQAGILARKDRSPLLGLDPSSPDLKKAVRDRSQDWSQVRPEWGLAGNYAFIAAPRERTKGIDLEGRVFLNDYCHAEDQDEATLELLLTAPVVVASWINLQYFASTVDNTRFGSGDKTIHNVAGLLGVYEGNGGDIRTGLPFQSVHDGKEWRHDPVRLHVCVEAPKESIDRILKKQPSVAELVSNQWIHLFAMSESNRTFEKSDGLGGWSEESPQLETQPFYSGNVVTAR